VTSPANITRGIRALRHLLQEETLDLRGLDVADFRRWLDLHLARWHNDQVFMRRARIRNLRRAHPRLRTLEEEHRHAVTADAASGPFSRLRWLDQELIDTAKAVAELTGALSRAGLDRRPALRQKLEGFQAAQQALRDEQEQLIRASPQRQTLLRIHAALERFRAAIGLDREEAHLARLLQEQGRRAGHAGASFARLAGMLAQSHIVPDLLRGGTRGGAAERVRVLQQVTFGATRTELDQLIIRQPRRRGQPVEVLAVVEIKRNVNDLAHGFRHRQENLAWLTGDTSHYDPALCRTRSFPSGHFDREAVHQQDGEPFVFAPSSFRRLRRDRATNLFLDRLYFITRTGKLWGVSQATLARIGFRVATDEGWEPDNDEYLRRLLRWCRSLAESVETPDVLQRYTATPKRGRQILLVGR
jgi:hypothetical protein